MTVQPSVTLPQDSQTDIDSVLLSADDQPGIHATLDYFFFLREKSLGLKMGFNYLQARQSFTFFGEQELDPAEQNSTSTPFFDGSPGVRLAWTGRLYTIGRSYDVLPKLGASRRRSI
ncbi:MAG TPA: hypothetical protein DCR93_01525 [Cytophagales bacterium]|nr:hypothetical protein [Cytophagales bacterium]HAP58234.1 hypothetical protein [Cytophagales bacterium]